MKRMFVTLIALLLLAGCSSGEASKVTKACSIEQSGMSIVMEATAQSEEADVEVITMTFTASWDSMGIDDEYLEYLDYFYDELIAELESQLESMIQTLGFLEDYVEMTSEIDDTGITVVAVIDIQTMIETEGYSSDYYGDISLNSFTASMEEFGFSCD